jgi:Na+/proline symporter
MVLLVYLAIIPGLAFEKGLTGFVHFAWAGLGASVGATSILALFWEKSTRKGVYAGLITGIVTAAVWKMIPELNSLVYELIPGFILALIVTMSVSLLTKNNISHNDIKKVSYSKTRKYRAGFEE